MEKLIFDSLYKGYQLNTSFKSFEGFKVKRLDRIFDLMNYMISRYCRVYFVRLDFTFPRNYPLAIDNSLLSKFIEYLVLYYNRTRHNKKTGKITGGYDPHYIWSKERSLFTGAFHYHICLLLDGTKLQSALGIKSKSEELWARHLGIPNAKGLIEFPLIKYGYYSGGLMIHRNAKNFPEVFQGCFQFVSYLAKQYSSNYGLPYQRDFSTSEFTPISETLVKTLHPHL